MSEYKFVILRNPMTMECSIHPFDPKYIGYTGVDVEVCGFAETMCGAYGVVNYTYEMER